MIRQLPLLLIISLSLWSCSNQKDVYMFSTFREPATEGLYLAWSEDGYHWNDLGGPWLKPEVGLQKVMRDPSVVKGPDGTFHMVWTSSWQGDKGFGHASSRDLINWSPQQFIPVMDFDTSVVNVWAPELFYDDEKKEYLIVWASTIPYRFPKGEEEERNNHRLYYTTTPDFKTFSETRLYLDPGFSVIDATMVKRGKEDYVLVLKDNTRPNRNLKVTFAGSPTGPFETVGKPFTRMFTEGPSVLKTGNDWLIYFDAYRDKVYGAVKTTDFINFTDVSDQVSLPPGHKHGTIFKADRKTLKGLISACSSQPDIVHYTGTTLNNPDYHHGQLSPAIGVHNIQVMRACREFPDSADGFGWTYNHAPMLAWWNNTFYLEYLSDSVGEHIPPGQTFLVTSRDGYLWTRPFPVFPVYKIPDGTTKEGVEGMALDLSAVNHQRMGFYVSSSNRLLVLAYIGISLDAHDSPNDGKGIGRVVREVNQDGTFGPVYFIRYNKGWNAENTAFPFYHTSPDAGFVEACNELLENPLMMQQWVEEADRDDPLIPLKKQYKALSYYHLQDGRVVGLWKEGLTSISNDEGKTWETPVRAPGIVTSNAKIWGQKTSDGKYATVYNPSDFRWPLAMSVSHDGLEYTNLLLVNGEITTMRYGGNYKSYGPQYVRGILEGNGTPPDEKLWVTYSMNKEDIWVSAIPVPVREKTNTHADDQFNQMADGLELVNWNIFSPLWARVCIEQFDGKKALVLHDRDPFDYAKAERIFPASDRVEVNFEITPANAEGGILQVELQDYKGTAALRLVFDVDGFLKMKAGYRMRNITRYEAGKVHKIRIVATTANRFYTVFVNDQEGKNGLFFAPVHALERLVFRTGETRRFPDTDTPTDQEWDVPDPGQTIPEARFCIFSVKTRNADSL